MKEEQEEKTDEDKSVIEEIIGKEDTFVSSFSEDYSKYRLPRLNLLKETGRQGKSVSNVKAANECGRKLIEILDEFGVKATLIATHIGPAVTKFEVKPDLGVRVNKISNLQHDIKMALAAKDIRIEAPIPGKSAVGIEIPNVEKTTVGMKELMRSIPDTYEEKKMLFCLGKDLMGDCIYGELNKMPHLLIAGATGSGKSVCVNSIITSILLRAKPNEVRMLLVDPKKVEFTPYQKIPHLIGPVITDGEEANRALKVIVNMMDNRYELFSMAGVRNIAGYNAYIEKHPEEGLQKMPWIVVITCGSDAGSCQRSGKQHSANYAVGTCCRDPFDRCYAAPKRGCYHWGDQSEYSVSYRICRFFGSGFTYDFGSDGCGKADGKWRYAVYSGWRNRADARTRCFCIG